jgi:hypothetical protein
MLMDFCGEAKGITAGAVLGVLDAGSRKFVRVVKGFSEK